MPETPQQYNTIIDRGYTSANDRIFDFLKPRIVPPYLDIGANIGALLAEVPGGIGIDSSPAMVLAARARGRDVRFGFAETLPYANKQFETAILSCVLEQCEDPARVVGEARRVAMRVIGVNPIPGASIWGSVGNWVKSVIPEDAMAALGAHTEPIDTARYYFEIA